MEHMEVLHKLALFEVLARMHGNSTSVISLVSPPIPLDTREISRSPRRGRDQKSGVVSTDASNRGLFVVNNTVTQLEP